MANTWKNPIILDTANNDGAYDSANDNNAQNSTAGVKYSTAPLKIKNIVITGANTNVVKLLQCSKGTLEGDTIIDITLETGALTQHFNFGDGIWFNGLIPKTITSGAKAYIYLG